MASLTLLTTSDTPNSGRIKINDNDTALNAELATTIHADGSVPMSATLPMGGYRTVNQGAGIDPSDGVIVSQLQNEVNKRVVKNFLEVATNYPITDSTSKRFASVRKALESISDATTGNWYAIKVYPNVDHVTGYSEELGTYVKNYVDLIGEGLPVVTVTPDSGQTATLTANGRVENIKFKFTGHNILASYLKLQGNGFFENCVFVLGSGLNVADLILGGVGMHNCQLVVPSTSQILLDGTTYNYVHACATTVDITTGTGVLESGCINSIIPNLVNWV
jgi:hypothetical protein